ncbi:hypothetical protein FQN57_000372 [Myotisia sp. PD_48]|nr:hypothetical protein FQN57_000372 [Myotisia sp. PD_48]
MKRKTDTGSEDPTAVGEPIAKKRALSIDLTSAFGDGLFADTTFVNYKKAYANSEPYKHGVILPLFNPDLLRTVRTEIQEHLSFTEKETDIYKIFQSGDLANLDGLDDASLARLPAIHKLRDALYSEQFREYLSGITGAGKLSGRKTDMAINVYTGGCHLLCHDDVIGSRRVSYILYLTDPDTPWQASWGGALRLYPTKVEKDAEGKEYKIPCPDFTVSIPPAFNQLSFFAVQPEESFHDVEEVYIAEGQPSEEEKKKRVRMAISGWFHIPQEGEDGYEEGLAEKLAERSSLQQLEGQPDEFDRPQPQFIAYDENSREDPDLASSKGKGPAINEDEEEDEEFTEKDLEFLVKYISPSYLTPDIIEQLSETFENDSSLSLERFLCDKFASRLRSYIEEQEKGSKALPASTDEIEQKTPWKVSRPPHKHRYLYQQTSLDKKNGSPNSPIAELLEELLPSRPFKKWLSIATGLDDLVAHNILARRFRRGEDYTLANTYDGESPRLEFTIGLTPTLGWEKDDEDDGDDDDGDGDDTKNSNGKTEASSKPEMKNGSHTKVNDANTITTESIDDGPSFGGYEIYMAGEDENDEDETEEASKEGGAVLGATGSKSKVNKSKADPAIYRTSADEDDGILFSMAAGWNRMSLVLRDKGTLKFVKYVSRSAPGDRWDVTGEIDVRYDEDGDDDEDAEVAA